MVNHIQGLFRHITAIQCGYAGSRNPTDLSPVSAPTHNFFFS